MEFVGKLFYLALMSIFVQNYLLARFLGFCPFLGCSKKMDSAFGMGMAVIFVMTMASAITFLLNGLLIRMHVEYLQTIVFILTIAALVQLVEMALQKNAPALYKALGIFLPLITTNCAVLGVALLNIESKWADGTPYNFIWATLQGFLAGVGFTMMLILMAGIRERLEQSDIPKPLQGLPIAFLIVGSMALAFLGFSGFKI